MSARPRPKPRPQNRKIEPSRLLPLSIAGVVCFLIALVLGYVGWYFFGTHKREAASDNLNIVQTPSATLNQNNATDVPSQTQNPPTPDAPTANVTLAPAGELPVQGGVVVLGGEGTTQPLRRETVEPFAVGETEVTNGQYAEFIKATGHKAPTDWTNGTFPENAQDLPVTSVAWQDAFDYCDWLSKKLGATVRLPNEKEWVLAAAGKDNFKYPWGNEWNPRAANFKGTAGTVRPVKSFPEGKSPYGAYDMAGNVWEWVSDDALGQDGKPKNEEGVKLKIIKGGSAVAKRDYLLTAARFELPSNEADAVVGFRYVVIRNKQALQSSTP